MEKARQVVREVDDVMHKTKGLADIQSSREENYPEVNVAVDREKAALLGISETDVANAVLYSFNGTGRPDPIIYTDPSNGTESYISAWLAEPFRSNLSDLERVLLTTPSGNPVLLKNVASLKLNSGPVKIDRKYFQRVVPVPANALALELRVRADELAAKLVSPPL